MSDKLLFESGSARVDKRGKEALAKLAEVLNKQSDIDVYIEGHTDSKPINTAQFKDNWDLSVIRATSGCPHPDKRLRRESVTDTAFRTWRIYAGSRQRIG